MILFLSWAVPEINNVVNKEVSNNVVKWMVMRRNLENWHYFMIETRYLHANSMMYPSWNFGIFTNDLIIMEILMICNFALMLKIVFWNIIWYCIILMNNLRTLTFGLNQTKGLHFWSRIIDNILFSVRKKNHNAILILNATQNKCDKYIQSLHTTIKSKIVLNIQRMYHAWWEEKHGKPITQTNRIGCGNVQKLTDNLN